MKKTIIIMSVLALLVISACAQEQPLPQEGLGEEPIIPDDPFNQGVQEPGTDLPDIVATVNGEEIRKEDVTNFQAQLQMQGMQLEQEDLINTIINRRLLIQEANNRNYEVTEEIVQEILAQEGITRELVEMQGMNYEEFIQEQMNHEDIGLSMLQREKIRSVEVTEEEARQIYDENAEQIEESFEEVREMLKNNIARQQAEFLLQDLITRLNENAEIEKFY